MARKYTRNTKIQDWKERCRKAFEHREKLYKDSDMRDFERYIYNKRFDNETTKRLYSVNLISVMLRRLVAVVYFQNPTILVRSLSPETESAVPIITRLWNTKIRQLGLKKEMRMAIQDAFTCGWGIMKLGYDSEFVVDAAAKEESESESALIEPAILLKDNRIAAGSPWWLRVHPADVAFEPGARNVDSSRWVVHRYFRQIDDLQADPNLENTRDLQPDMDLSLNKAQISIAYEHDIASGPTKKDGLALIYEIRDVYEGKMYITPANQKDRWLYNDVDEISRLTGRQMFYPIIFNPISKSPYGVSTVDLLDKPQKEFNDIRTQDAKQRRISIMKILGVTGLLDEDAKEQLTSEDVGAFVETTGDISDSRLRVFQPHQGMDMQIAAENCRRDMRELSGLGRVQMGEQAAGRHTATESAQVQSAHDMLVQFYRDIVRDVILDLIQDAHKLIAGTPAVSGFWTDERIIDLTSGLGARVPVKFKGVDLQGDYDFDLAVDTAPPPSRTQIKQERAIIAQNLANHPRVNQDYLLRWVCEAFEDLDGNRLIIPEQQYNTAMAQTLQAQQQAEQQNKQQELEAEAAADQRKQDSQLARAAIDATWKMQTGRGEK